MLRLLLALAVIFFQGLAVCVYIDFACVKLIGHNLQIPRYQNILELPTHKEDIIQFLIMFVIFILILTFPFMISAYYIL